MSTRSRLLKLTGRRFLPVEVPGFGSLRVRSLTEGERSIVEEFADLNQRVVKRVILILSLVEAESEAVVFPFTDEDQLRKIVAELETMDAAVVDGIVSVSMKLNRISEADVRSMLGEPVAS